MAQVLTCLLLWGQDGLGRGGWQGRRLEGKKGIWCGRDVDRRSPYLESDLCFLFLSFLGWPWGNVGSTPSSMVGQVLSSSTALDPSVTFVTSHLCNLELYTSPHTINKIVCSCCSDNQICRWPIRVLPHDRWQPSVGSHPLPAPHCSFYMETPFTHTLKAVQGTCPALPMTSSYSQVWSALGRDWFCLCHGKEIMKVTQKGNTRDHPPPHLTHTSLPAVLLSQVLFLPSPNCLTIQSVLPRSQCWRANCAGGVTWRIMGMGEDWTPGAPSSPHDPWGRAGAVDGRRAPYHLINGPTWVHRDQWGARSSETWRGYKDGAEGLGPTITQHLKIPLLCQSQSVHC
jgi:hypothetical protein